MDPGTFLSAEQRFGGREVLCRMLVTVRDLILIVPVPSSCPSSCFYRNKFTTMFGKRTFFNIILLSTIFIQIHSLEVYLNGTLWKTYRATSMKLKDHDFNITGIFIRADPLSGCSPLKNSDMIRNLSLSQTVVVLTSTETDGIINCDPDIRVKHVSDSGASVMVYGSTEYAAGYGITAYAFNKEPGVQNSHIISVDIKEDKKLYDLLKDPANYVTVVVTDDPNLWYENRHTFTACTVVFEICHFAILGFVLFRLYQFIYHFGIQPSIPQICLGLEVIGAISTIFFILLMTYTVSILFFVDPSYCQGVWRFDFTAFLGLTHFFWPMSSTLLLTFYWEEVMRAAHIQIFPKLAKMKIPAIISVSVLAVLVIIVTSIRISRVNVNIILVNGIIQVCFWIPSSVFFCYGSYRILKTLYQSKSLSSSSRNLRKVTLMLLGVACSYFLAVLCISLPFPPSHSLGLLLFVAVPFSIEWFIVNRFLLYTAETGVAFFLVSSFQNPSQETSQESQGSKSNAKRPTSVELQSVVESV